MNNKVDIIIPAYNAHKTIDRTLFSIAMQDNIKDIYVYIVNDGSIIDYSEQVNKFSKFMKVKELLLKKNSGPGYAREYGIEHSSNDFLVFIDSDDILFNSNSIINLLNSMNNDKSDIVISNFREEVNNGYISHENDIIFMHGKMYKRKFLIDNDIKFNNSYANEDNGFNNLLLLHNPKISYLNEETYIWKNNSQSITRKNNHEYNIKGLNGYIYNIEWALNIAIEHNCDNYKIAELAYCCFIAVYLYYLQYKDNSLIKNVKNIYDITKKYSLTNYQQEEVFKNQFDFFINDDNKMIFINPVITFNDFKDMVMNHDICS